MTTAGVLEQHRGRTGRSLRSERVLLAILAASIVSTAIHYADNYFAIERYPGPEWIQGPVIYVGWIVLTAIGVLGYVLYRRAMYLPAILCLLVYSYTGVSSLGHFLYGDWSGFTSAMHVSILADGVTGSAVLAFAIWAGVQLQRGRLPASSVLAARRT
jgi:hypothetical protein